MLKTVGVRELKNQASSILREVREELAEYVVTVHGEPVAIIHPITQADAERLRQEEIEIALAEMKVLAKLVADAWVSEKSGVELVDEQRR
ncbi:MAG: type II toxin-antitoxin system prevent-host-death family antitoxin [Anaerolineales bacterium]|nr:type II toxin-antitoxin system prevent-host-death family antitoxin [Anaerolineales bacterium]